MKQREAIEVNTSENAKLGAKEPSLPVFIPMRLLRWFTYTAAFGIMLAPGFWQINARGVIGASFILGHFASQLNTLINKKP